MSVSVATRLVVIVLLALVGIGAAATALVRTHRQSDAARKTAAFTQADSVAESLQNKRDALPASVAETMSRGDSVPAGLAAYTAALLAPLTDASAGYCLPDGKLIARQSIVPPHINRLPLPPHGRLPRSSDLLGNIRDSAGPGLFPIDRDFIVNVCRNLGSAQHKREQLDAPRDTLYLTVRGGHAPFAAWALVRTSRRDPSSDVLGSPFIVALIALAMVALVALCVDTVLRVRRGIDTLASALVAVQSNLSTPIRRPSTPELARIADGLCALTAHLSEARERELGLERKLSHERRLGLLGRVAAGVAHEIRNPLAGIKLRLDAMARRSLDERSARDVERSLGEVARLDAVIGSLLLVARKDPAPLSDVDLGALVEERLAALEAFAAQRGVRVFCVSRDGAARARIDAAGIARVVDNLVRNGVEASPDGAEVRVELSRSRSDVELRVVDRGAGIAVGRQGELFEPFFTSKPDGTGLGLSLSRAAVEAHGGTLTYARAEGATSFIVRLPGSTDP